MKNFVEKFRFHPLRDQTRAPILIDARPPDGVLRIAGQIAPRKRAGCSADLNL